MDTISPVALAYPFSITRLAGARKREHATCVKYKIMLFPVDI